MGIWRKNIPGRTCGHLEEEHPREKNMSAKTSRQECADVSVEQCGGLDHSAGGKGRSCRRSQRTLVEIFTRSSDQREITRPGAPPRTPGKSALEMHGHRGQNRPWGHGRRWPPLPQQRTAEPTILQSQSPQVLRPSDSPPNRL